VKSHFFVLFILLSTALLFACGGDSKGNKQPEYPDIEVGSGTPVYFQLAKQPTIDISGATHLIATAGQLLKVSSDGKTENTIQDNINKISSRGLYYDSEDQEVWIAIQNDATSQSPIDIDPGYFSSSTALIGPALNFELPLKSDALNLLDDEAGASYVLTSPTYLEDGKYDKSIEELTGIPGPHYCERRLSEFGDCIIEFHVFPEGRGENKSHYNLHVGSMINTIESNYFECDLLKAKTTDTKLSCGTGIHLPEESNYSINIYGFEIPLYIPTSGIKLSHIEPEKYWDISQELKFIQKDSNGLIHIPTDMGIKKEIPGESKFTNISSEPVNSYIISPGNKIVTQDYGVDYNSFEVVDSEVNGSTASFYSGKSHYSFDKIESIISAENLFNIDAVDKPVNFTHGPLLGYRKLKHRPHISDSGTIYVCDDQKGIIPALPQSEVPTEYNYDMQYDCNDVTLISDKYHLAHVSDSDIYVTYQPLGEFKGIFKTLSYENYQTASIRKRSILLSNQKLSFVAEINDDGQLRLFEVDLNQLLSDTPGSGFINTLSLFNSQLYDISYLKSEPPMEQGTDSPRVSDTLFDANDRRYIGLNFNVSMDKQSVNEGISLTHDGESVFFIPLWVGDIVYVVPLIYPEWFIEGQNGELPPADQSYFESGKTYQLQLDINTVRSESGLLMVDNPEPNASHDFTFN